MLFVAMAEEGIKFTALRASQYEAARELYVDLRMRKEGLDIALQQAAAAPAAPMTAG